MPGSLIRPRRKTENVTKRNEKQKLPVIVMLHLKRGIPPPIRSISPSMVVYVKVGKDLLISRIALDQFCTCNKPLQVSSEMKRLPQR